MSAKRKGAGKAERQTRKDPWRLDRTVYLRVSQSEVRRGRRSSFSPRRNFRSAYCLVLTVYFLPGCGRDAPLPEPTGSSAPSSKREPAPQRLANPSLSLLEAAFAGDADQARLALDQGADPNERSDDDRTSLMLAAFDGHTETLRVLLDRGAQVDDRDPAGRTALMYAASGPNAESVRLLLDWKADPLVTDLEEQFTALMFAAAEGHPDVVQILLDYDSDPKMVDIDGETALDFATQSGHLGVVRLLGGGRK